MTTVIKLSGNTTDSVEKLRDVVLQIRELTDNIILMVSGSPETRRRIVESPDNGRLDPKELFRNFEESYQELGQPAILRGFRDVIYLATEKMNSLGDLRNGQELVSLYAYGEEIPAMVLYHILRESSRSAIYMGPEPKFPIQVRGDVRNASIDDITITEEMKKGLIILPAACGWDNRDPKYHTKLFDRGGGDVAASAVAKKIGANQLLFVTDMGVREAPYQDAKIVKEVDLEEAEAGAYFNVGVSNPRAIQLWKDECHLTSIYMADAKHMMNGTRVVRETDDKRPVKFVASRNIEEFRITEYKPGSIIELLQKISKAGLSYFYEGGPGRLRLYVPDSNSRTVKRIISELDKHVTLAPGEHGELSYVGAVGSMKKVPGVMGRYGRVLANEGINIIASYDPNENSLGTIISRKDGPRATMAAYREFLQQ